MDEPRWQVLHAAPFDVAAALRDERVALVDLLGGLSAPDWKRPTDCPAWTVRDVAAHVLHDDLRLLAHLRDGYAGVWFDGPAAELGPWLHDRNQRFVDGTADLSSGLLVDLLAWTGPRLDDVYATRDPDALDDSVAWAVPDGPCPNWLGTGREYTERLAHHNQIRRACGRAELGGARWLGPALDVWRWCLPVALDRTNGTVRLDVADVERSWLLRDGRFIEHAPGDGPDAEAVADAATLARLWTAAPDADFAVASGDPDLLAALRRARAIVV